MQHGTKPPIKHIIDTEKVLGKALPYNVEAERSVLGSLLLDDQTLSSVSDFLLANDFYSSSHRIIYETILEVHQKFNRLDLVTLQDELEKKNKLDLIGGAVYLLSLQEDIPSVGMIETHAKIIKEKSVLRDLIHSATSIITNCYNQNSDEIETVLDEAEKVIFNIANKRTTNQFVQLNIWLKKTFQHLNDIKTHRKGITGVPGGYNKLDEMTSGFQAGDLIVLAARPSMGKTALALNIATKAAEEGFSVGFFSLEMSAEQLTLRLLSTESGVGHHHIRNATISSEEWLLVTNTASRLAQMKMFIDDTPMLTVMDVRAKARKLKAEHKLDFLVIDYLQLLHAGRRHENRHQEVSEISRSLKALAKELGIPILSLSQLSRAVDGRMDKRPMLSDLRECVTGDTLVVLSDGQRKPIKELIGTTPAVLTMTSQGKITQAVSDKVWSVGIKPVYEVHLASGRSIKATEEHRLFGDNGWVKIKDLQEGSRLAVVDYEELLGSDSSKEKATTDFFWDHVTEIIPLGEQEVFDLTVPETACWLADGIVSHNSGAIEQDADLIMFLYRDVQYNPETENPALAELIIGKQRNGPTGTVYLNFLRELTKFEDADE
jgi:replicative DNA helicase